MLVIEFHLDARSGVAPYLQLIHQVRHALRLDVLREGEQLPTVKDVAAGLAINPNTVLKAYRELESRGLASGRPGQGTFIDSALAVVPMRQQRTLRVGLHRWLGQAKAAGLEPDAITAMFTAALYEVTEDEEGVS
jgi:DNA-binding transcriptional regulator YhcF (GntR family)